MEATHVMEVAQLLLSLIHSWGLDPHLDKVCETQLGLLRPMVGVMLYDTEFRIYFFFWFYPCEIVSNIFSYF